MSGVFFKDINSEEQDFLNGPKALFHFTSFNNLLNILINNTLKFGYLANMKDPFEYIINMATYGYRGDISDTDAITDHHVKKKELLNIIKSKAKTISFCSNTTFIESDNGINFYRYNDGKDFTPEVGYLKHRMWEQYGDKHKGVCLVFDEDVIKYISKENKLHYRNVGYSRNEKKAYLSNTWSKNDAIDLLFQKPMDYRDESESRIASLDYNVDYINYSDSLKYIILGFNTSPVQLYTLNSLSKQYKKNIPILKYELNENATPYQKIWRVNSPSNS